MLQYPVIVPKEEVLKLVPASLIDNVACFALYDNHPKDQRCVDISVCTKKAEVIEFYERNKLASITLNCPTTPEEITLFRNSAGRLFYLVFAGELLFIINRNETLQLHKTVSDVFRYEIIDKNCNGYVNLKVILKSDAVPLIYNDNFECLGDGYPLDKFLPEDASPITLQLQRKLTEAKYNVTCNEKALNELISLRQRVVFSQYEKHYSNLKDTVFNSMEEIASSLKIKTQVPWVKSCNQKLIIVLIILNQDIVPLKDVNILLRNTSQSLVYSTKLFEKISKPPLWTESPTLKVKPDLETAVIGVINIEQLKNNILSKIEFQGTICCKKEGNDCFMPFNDVTISSLDTMGEDFDVLSSMKYDENDMLAVLSTTEKLDLILKPLINLEEASKALNILETFCTYLHMEKIFSNIIIHRKSPYHILNGLMIDFHNYDDFQNRPSYLVSVYARTPSQLLALLHHIYDSIPFRIIINVHNNKNETNSTDEGDNLHPVSKKMDMILEYLDNLMAERSEIKDSMGQNRIPSGSFKNLLAMEDEDQLLKVGFDDRKASRIESMVID